MTTLLLAGLSQTQAQSYTISTLAGVAANTGTNDGVNQDARFSFPVGLALDSAGNLFVADFLNHAIRKLSRTGTNWAVTTIAGLPGTLGYADGTNSDARFNRPTGIAVDKAGNLFVSERGNHDIREISPVGTNWVVTTIAGLPMAIGFQDGTNSEALFHLPSGIAMDNSNRLYVADTSNSAIREIAPLGTNWVVTTIAGGLTNIFVDGTNMEASFDFPYDIALSASGKLYVADWGNNAIREMSQVGNDWIVTTIAGTGGVGATDGPGIVASFNNPAGVAVDRAGNVYVTDQSNSTIRKLAPGQTGWTVTTLAGQPLKTGSTDGVSTNALFKKPWGIAVDGSGNLFIADYSNSTIRSGTAPASGAPVLHIGLSGGQIILTWPVSPAGYVLAATDTLGSGSFWVAVTNGVVTIGDQMAFTNNMTTAGGFYRLQRVTPGGP